MSRGALFTTPLEFDLGASWCAGVIALLKSQSLILCSGTTRDPKNRGPLPLPFFLLVVAASMANQGGPLRPAVSPALAAVPCE